MITIIRQSLISEKGKDLNERWNALTCTEIKCETVPGKPYLLFCLVNQYSGFAASLDGVDTNHFLIEPNYRFSMYFIAKLDKTKIQITSHTASSIRSGTINVVPMS